MSTRARELVLRWLLLGAVAFGIVAMHHLAADHGLDSPAMAMSAMADLDPSDHAPLPDPTSPHGPLQTCMAVVSGAGAILALAILFGLWWPTSRTWMLGRRSAPIAGRSPPSAAGRALLSSVCVLRL